MNVICRFIYVLKEFIWHLNGIVRKITHRLSKKGNSDKITFALYNKNGAQIGAYTTDSNGKINISDLKIGTYILSEIPPSFDIDKN